MHAARTRPYSYPAVQHKHRAAVKMAATNAAKLQEVQRIYNTARKPDVPDMSPEKLWDRIEQQQDASLVIVDTREAAEQEVSVLPGPTVTQQQFKAKSAEYRQHTVVCYCTAGVRSGQYAAELRREGFSAYNLEGSILGWTHAGYPLVELHERSKQTKRVHVYGQRWALQADGYEPVMFAAPALNLAKTGVQMLASWMNPRNWWPVSKTQPPPAASSEAQKDTTAQ